MLASDDLVRITRHIRQSSPAAARKVASTLYDGGMSLELVPYRVRNGRIAGTRELVMAPFILVYRVKTDAIEILRIYHSAQDWPQLAAGGTAIFDDTADCDPSDATTVAGNITRSPLRPPSAGPLHHVAGSGP